MKVAELYDAMMKLSSASAKAAAVFDENELAQVIAMAVTINAWNRLNVTTRMKAPRR